MFEIKPCPHCGSKAKLFTSANGVAVMCTDRNCGCRTRWYVDTDIFYNDWLKGGKVSVEKAIEVWNRRAADGE